MDTPAFRAHVLPMLLANAQVATSPEGQASVMGAYAFAHKNAIEVAAKLHADGYLASVAEAIALAERCMAYGADDRPSERTRFYTALTTDCTAELDAYLRDRSKRFGGRNGMTIELRGRTATGKSAAARTLAQRLRLTAAEVRHCFTWHPRPYLRSIAALYKRIQAGEANVPRVVVLDEANESVGEGSATKEKLIRNQEGRLRETGISQIFCRPNVTDDMTRDVTIETIGINLVRREVLGIVYINGIAIGTTRLPFCADDVTAAYQVLKDFNLEYAAKLGNPDAAIMRAHVLEILLDDQLMGLMKTLGWRKESVRMAIDDELGGAMSVNEVNRIADRVVDVGPKWGDDGDWQQFGAVCYALQEKGIPGGWIEDAKWARLDLRVAEAAASS